MVQAVTGSDLNPDFSFDFGAGVSPAQAPWEMSGTYSSLTPPCLQCQLADSSSSTVQVLPDKLFLQEAPVWMTRYNGASRLEIKGEIVYTRPR